MCVYGVCMVRPSGDGACVSAGTALGCPDGTLCWGLAGHDGQDMCFPSCRHFECAGTCDAGNDCVPSFRWTRCDPACGSFCMVPGASSSCRELADCVLACQADLSCRNECVRGGTSEAQRTFQEYLGCAGDRCREVEHDPDAYSACLTRECSEQLQACQEQGA